MRPSKRKFDQIREVTITPNVNKHAEGSCLIKFGDTHVICTASIEEKVPPFLRNKGTGWVTAEYNMLARSTHSRMNSDPMKPNGRSIEIKRLIGRALRSAIDTRILGERQIIIDCDVIQADGGTRCAAITGGYVALALAVNKLVNQRVLRENPLTGEVCAVSCGIYNGEVVADLDYLEDSKCETDSNFVLNKNFDLIEIQGTAEVGSMSFLQLSKMYDLAKKAAVEIFGIQKKAIQN
ncbi:MAG: ribonuclease PH [Proteobacteria bacterium]|nr:ribonuclease PH [Pseudomonadota bacterium]